MTSVGDSSTKRSLEVVAPELNPAKMMKDFQERAEFVLNADKHLAEVVRLLKNTNETLENLNKVVGRLIGMLHFRP